MDALNHVNNAVYHTYLEEGRIGFMKSIGIYRDPHRLKGIGWILVRTEIDFRTPAVFGDVLVTHIKPGALKNSSFELVHRITRESDDTLIVEAKSVQVCLDYATHKPVRVPDEWRAILAQQA